MKIPLKKVLEPALRYGLGIGILVYFFDKDDFQWDKIQSLFHPSNLVILLALKFLVYFLVSLRWRRILRELEVKATVGQALSFGFLAIFFTYFLPGNMSSDVGKSFFASRVFGSPGKVIFAIVLDRFIGLFSLLALLLIGIALFYRQQSPQFQQLWALISGAPWHYLAAAFVLGLAIVASVIALLRWHPKFIKARDVLTKMTSPSFWFSVVGLSLLSHLTFAAFLATAAGALGLERIDFLGCLIVFPLSTLAMIVPLTPGSLGVGQVVYEFLFDLYAGAPTEASLLFTALQVMDLVFVAYGAWYFVRLLKFNKEPR